MIKTTKAKVLFITLMSAGILLYGCNNAESQNQNTTKETTETVKGEEVAAEEIETVESEAAETEPTQSESSSEETTETGNEEETAVEENETAEQETEISEEPVEVIDLANYGTIEKFFSSLDPDKLAIVVYNPEEGYVINMQEGQYYQLKSADQILFNFTSGIGYGLDECCGDSFLIFENFSQLVELDYSKMNEKHEFFLKKKLDSGEIIQLTCYFDPPTE